MLFRSLGLEKEIGSLEVGKAADIVAVDMSGIETSPCYDTASHLVYAASREHVSHVWVAGNLLLDNRVATQLDLDAIRTTAHTWRETIATRKNQ